MIAPLSVSAASAAVVAGKGEGDPRRHRLACRLLRNAGKANFRRESWESALPMPRPGESIVDYLVRAELAQTPQDASAGLVRA